MQVLSRAEWEPRATAHAERVERWIRPHLRGEVPSSLLDRGLDRSTLRVEPVPLVGL